MVMDSSHGSTHSKDSADDHIQQISRDSQEQPEDGAEISLPGSGDAVSMERHRDLMLATLLEEYYRGRAVDILNVTNPGRVYTRQSPEVEAIARQLFAQGSRVLSSNGLIPSGATSDESQSARRQYLSGLERLFAASHTPNVVESMRQVVIQANQLNLTTHPSNDLQLTLNQSPSSPLSHYKSFFREVSLLGRGGFGRVYRCYNHLDQTTYAVKKIILPSKVVKGLSDGRHDKLQHILQEAKAMAMLDHPNIVRYHATWIEEPQRTPGLSDGSDNTMDQPGRPGQQLLLDSRAFDQYSDQGSSFSGGIVFGEDTPSHQSAEANDHDPSPENRGWSENDLSSLSIADTVSAAESEIFTGGATEQGNSPPRQSAPDANVYALYIQMSMYPMTLAQFISPSSSSDTGLRHCFHLAPTLRLVLSIHDGLQYIHSKGLIHRDIKPGNIFLSSPLMAFESGYCDSSCKLCKESHHECASTSRWLNPRIGDFGLASQLVQGDVSSASESSTDYSYDVGTAYYRPPRKDEAKDEKTDIFALGVVFVEMICRCNTAMERAYMLKDLQNGKVPPKLQKSILDEGHDLETAERVTQLVSSMTDGDPDQRWSGLRVREALQDLLGRCKG
ncbi:kinase-like protein [Xylaria nigripes]|nr:kinase-like protein [Xylaria nigripes]